jgi:hypothetical protein
MSWWREVAMKIQCCDMRGDRLYVLVVRVLGYRSGGPGSIPGTTRKRKKVEIVAAPV